MKRKSYSKTVAQLVYTIVTGDESARDALKDCLIEEGKDGTRTMRAIVYKASVLWAYSVYDWFVDEQERKGQITLGRKVVRQDMKCPNPFGMANRCIRDACLEIIKPTPKEE